MEEQPLPSLAAQVLSHPLLAAVTLTLPGHTPGAHRYQKPVSMSIVRIDYSIFRSKLNPKKQLSQIGGPRPWSILALLSKFIVASKRSDKRPERATLTTS